MFEIPSEAPDNGAQWSVLGDLDKQAYVDLWRVGSRTGMKECLRL